MTFSPRHGPGREDFDGTGGVHRPARAEPGAHQLEEIPYANCSTDRGGGRSDLRPPAQKMAQTDTLGMKRHSNE